MSLTSTRAMASATTAAAAVGGGRRPRFVRRQVEAERRHLADGRRDGPRGGADEVFFPAHDPSFRVRPTAASARWVVDFTVPVLTPMTCAVSSTDRSR